MNVALNEYVLMNVALNKCAGRNLARVDNFLFQAAWDFANINSIIFGLKF